MESALSVSCIFQGRGGVPAAQPQSWRECRGHRQGPKEFHQLPRIVLGERLSYLSVAVVLGDMNVFPVFNILNGDDPFRSKEIGPSVDKLEAAPYQAKGWGTLTSSLS